MRTVLEVLRLSTEFLEKKGIKHPRRQAEELVGEVLKIGRLGIYLEFDRPVNEEELEVCRLWLKRRGQGEPLSYILGKVSFLNCELKVTSDVLIPRQETEILADKIIKEIEGADAGKVLWDICCGSGCLGLSLKKRYPNLQVTLSDVSPAALAIAKENAQSNQVQVEFLEGDLLMPFKGKKADYIVCNPPYIAESEMATLEREVAAYEPKQALIAGKTGLEFYVRLSQSLPQHLQPKAKVWLEIGDGQGEALQKIFDSPQWTRCSVELDWSGRERFFSLEIE